MENLEITETKFDHEIVEKIYVASKTCHAPMWRELRDKMDWPIISTWIDEAEPGQTKVIWQFWIKVLQEISQCSRLIIYVHESEILKGAFIEAGVALALNVPIHVVLSWSELNDSGTGPVPVKVLGSWIEHPLVSCHTHRAVDKNDYSLPVMNSARKTSNPRYQTMAMNVAQILHNLHPHYSDTEWKHLDKSTQQMFLAQAVRNHKESGSDYY